MAYPGTMNLNNIISRAMPPEPWSEGDNIPWNDPAFSERMLREHLNQVHSLASRRFEVIDKQVNWIHEEMLERRPTKILALTCGPGLYTSRLAKLGHDCTGIDYAPASIRHAEESARAEGLSCTYQLGDVREAAYGEGYGLVMMNFGQFNVFRKEDARQILAKARKALAQDGLLLLEPQKFATVEGAGTSAPSWYACGEGGGLFSDMPHLCLQENFWDPEAQAATQRFFIVDAASGTVTRHALTTLAYTDSQLRDALTQTGYADIHFFPSLAGDDIPDESQSANLAIVARKG